MLNPNLRQEIERVSWRRDANPGTEWAIEQAIESLLVTDTDDSLQAAKMLMAVLDQCGCEHLVTGYGGRPDGRLVDVIDVIVYG